MALVNKTHPLPEDWENKLETVHITNSVGDDVEVEKKAYDAYLRLKEELEKEDIHVDLDSARRSVADQQRIMDDFTEQYGKDYALKTVAAPGYSEHHTGLALDLYLIIDGKDVVENEDMIQYPEIWSKIHAKLADHGFILRYLEDKEHITGYGYEPWHIRYLDNTDTAKEIMSKGITLEGYLGTASEADVSIDLGNSEIYTQDELKDAVIQIKCKFASLASCELKSIRYAGDEAANDENLKRMTYADGYYKPMISLVKYLTENGFKVYINSGSELNMLRELSQDVLGEYVPPYQIIGTRFGITATGQGETKARDYTPTAEDKLTFDGTLKFKDLKLNKVVSIINDLGISPLLSFGNSSGDTAMAQYVMQHGGKAYMLLCDDTERDHGDTEEAASFKADCETLGIETVSMKNEFTTIYGDFKLTPYSDTETEQSLAKAA